MTNLTKEIKGKKKYLAEVLLFLENFYYKVGKTRLQFAETSHCFVLAFNRLN